MGNVKSNWRCLLGLTGGMGSGKSVVLEMFRKKGARTLDSDAIVRSLLNKKSVLGSIKRKFGRSVFRNGNTLDKKALATLIFASKPKRKALEQLLHPLVRKEIFAGLKNGGKVAVVDVPLLFESGWTKRFDKIVVVNASMPVRLKRLAKRGFSASDAKNRIKAQWPLAKKVRLADYVVNNNGPLAQTKKQIDQIWKKLPIAESGGR